MFTCYLGGVSATSLSALGKPTCKNLIFDPVLCHNYKVYLCSRGALAAVRGSRFGTGLFRKEDVVMDEVNCEGVEWRLQDCKHSPTPDCPLTRAAGVMCALNDGGCLGDTVLFVSLAASNLVTIVKVVFQISETCSLSH